MTVASTTPTPSLQRRVTLVVLALLAVLLVVLGVTIDVTMGVLTRHNLHDIESLAFAIGDVVPKFVGPMQTVAEPHPARIADPEERCAIAVFEEPPTCRDA